MERTTYVVLASNNPKKRNELMLGLGLPISVVQTPVALVESGLLEPPIPEPVEDAQTYEENAAIKARAFSEWAATVAIADDSGLEVDALDGRPGVRSARYAGESATDDDNVRRLLEELDGVLEARRTARFVCAIHVEGPDGLRFSTVGRCEGRIATAPRGSTGFGYDPVFIPADHEQTFAELPSNTKAEISHRARALQSLREEVESGTLKSLAQLRGLAT